MTKTVNKVILIGNVSWDPRLRQSEGGRAVCSFGVATNRSWTTETGEKREETDFHRLVAFGKLAEICHEYLSKGRLVYIEGRLHSHVYTNNEGIEKPETEVYVDDMRMLDAPHQEAQRSEPKQSGEPVAETNRQPAATPTV